MSILEAFYLAADLAVRSSAKVLNTLTGEQRLIDRGLGLYGSASQGGSKYLDYVNSLCEGSILGAFSGAAYGVSNNIGYNYTLVASDYSSSGAFIMLGTVAGAVVFNQIRSGYLAGQHDYKNKSDAKLSL